MNVKRTRILLWVGYVLTTLAVSGGYISVSFEFITSMAYGIGFTLPLFIICCLINGELNIADANNGSYIKYEEKMERKLAKKAERKEKRLAKWEKKVNQISWKKIKTNIIISILLVSIIAVLFGAYGILALIEHVTVLFFDSSYLLLIIAIIYPCLAVPTTIVFLIPTLVHAYYKKRFEKPE